MKIIHVVLGKANPERMNGVNKVAHSLATHQKEAGAEVEIWGITASPNEVVKNRTYTVRLFQSGKMKWRTDNALKKAFSELGKQSLVHFHAGFIPEFYSIANLLISLGIPYVITPHGNYMQGAMQKNKWIKTIYFQWFESKIIKNARFVHCIGGGELKDICKLGITGNLLLIPNGQDFREMTFQFQQLQKSHTPVFGFCGRITRFQKGLDLLLEGFRLYKLEENATGLLWLIGEGEYKEEMEELVVKYGLENEVKFFGARFGEEKLNIISNMDTFYHPSRNEGLSIAILEAAALGKTLVVSEFTNMTDYVSDSHAGICLQQNTPAEIAASMMKIASWHHEGILNRTGQNARRMAEEHFDWKKITAKMLNAYENYSAVAFA